ncbi:hypothetical protein PAAG_12012 [Paracoccidioides lutzii Pb01]|uniref:Uncharacterized protein n=1 Tax=Paracoccidioides lutzii (strain ATCC MYA-826 / Pb01) TaxID=502779 RepID=A0A0A2VK35_PARBA|nr:hypothetical protein PAAG_12012 [Paracoccidioides lutzii Pb01]KGQ01244.1 hypothetical protein PAAG_12012 [Paracoccidioides lutzii Pb01]
MGTDGTDGWMDGSFQRTGHPVGDDVVSPMENEVILWPDGEWGRSATLSRNEYHGTIREGGIRNHAPSASHSGPICKAFGRCRLSLPHLPLH